MLESLYFEDRTCLEQVVAPLGKLLRRNSYSAWAKFLVERLQRFGIRRTGIDFVETAWTINLFSGSLGHRIPYQVDSIYLDVQRR
jgi:hypothetical protein